MSVISRILAMVALCLASSIAFAQAEAPVGYLNLLVFDAELKTPRAAESLRIDGLPVVTDSDGALYVPMAPGEHVLTHPSDARLEVRFKVVAGAPTELVVSIGQAVSVIDLEVTDTATAAAPIAKDAGVGQLSGRVVSREGDKPIVGARVFVAGSGREAITAEDGTFTLDVKAGEHQVAVLHSGFRTRKLKKVKVAKDSSTRIEVKMRELVARLQTVQVTVPRVKGGTATLLANRRESNAVADAVGAEQMSKSGDSNAASALSRVTGLSVVGGKYVYVRGMGERYSSTQLNGSTLPSPEPERRVIPLDVFPSRLLQGIFVPKTYSVEYPGEFGGGTIRLQTRGIPDQRVAEISLSTGGLTGTSFSEGVSYQGGGLDFLGFDDGTRALPDAVRAASDQGKISEGIALTGGGFSRDQLEAFGRSMSNTWEISRQTTRPNFGLSGSFGDAFKVFGKRVGVLASLTYGNKNASRRRVANFYDVGAGEELALQNSYEFERTENVVQLGGLLNAGIELAKGHKIESTTSLVRSTGDETREYQGFNGDVDADIRVTRLRFVERSLIAQQLSGQHGTEKDRLSLGWRYTFALASRGEPDRREYRYDLDPVTNLWLLSNRPEGNQRLFSELSDFNHDAAVHFTYRPSFLDPWKGALSAGPQMVLKDRTVDTRRYKFLEKGSRSTDLEVISLPPEQIFTGENIGPDGFQFEEITRETDNYSGIQRIFAGYLKADLTPFSWLNVSGGLRLEQSLQEVQTFELFNPANVPVSARLSNLDWLPAVNVAIRPTEKMAVRMGVSRTVTRPEFRELSQATFNDVTGGRQIFGNPDLQRGTIANVDARVEYYPSSDEVLSVGAFFKDFANPIEQIVIVSAQQSVSYDNAAGATNVGLEIEGRKRLGFIHPFMRDFYVAANASLIRSRVDLTQTDGIQTSKERALQGQSPYVFNAQLGYDVLDRGFVTVLYNVFGARISEVGAQRAPDIYERPVHRLDVVASYNLSDTFRVGAKAQNLLNPTIERTQGGLLTDSFQIGRSFSLSLSARL